MRHWPEDVRNQTVFNFAQAADVSSRGRLEFKSLHSFFSTRTQSVPKPRRPAVQDLTGYMKSILSVFLTSCGSWPCTSPISASFTACLLHSYSSLFFSSLDNSFPRSPPLHPVLPQGRLPSLILQFALHIASLHQYQLEEHQPALSSCSMTAPSKSLPPPKNPLAHYNIDGRNPGVRKYVPRRRRHVRTHFQICSSKQTRQ